jgi:hypothetical protein
MAARRDSAHRSATLSWRGDATVAISDIPREKGDTSPVLGRRRKIVLGELGTLIFSAEARLKSWRIGPLRSF